MKRNPQNCNTAFQLHDSVCSAMLYGLAIRALRQLSRRERLGSSWGSAGAYRLERWRRLPRRVGTPRLQARGDRM